MKHLKQLLILVLLTFIGIGQMWAANASFTITFGTGSGDGTEATTSTSCATIVSNGSSYLSGNLATATRVYYNGSSGLKLGASSSKAGTLKMNLSTSGQVTPTSIVVNAKRYNSNKAVTLKVNGSSTQSLTSSFDDYTYDITSAITYIQIDCSQYCWISSITVNYTTSGGGSGKTSVLVDPSSWNFGDVYASASASKTFSVSGTNLTSGQNLTLTAPTGYTVEPTSITVNNATLSATNVTVTKDKTTVGANNGNLSISGGGQASAKTVALTMNIVADPTYATLPFSYTSGRNNIASTDGMEQSGLGTDYSAQPYLKFDDTGDYVVIRFNAAPKELTYDIQGNSFSGGTFKVQTSTDGTAYTDLVSHTSLGSKSSEKQDLASTVRYIKFVYTSKSSGNVGLGNIGISKLPTTATLTYDLNGKTLSSGTKPSDASNVTLNQAYTLPTSTLGATGYTFVGWNNNKDANSKLTTFTPTAPTTYTMYAIWTPNTNTAYTVKHYKQNLAGNGYNLADTDNLTGTTDASVTPNRKNYTGFATPNGQTVTILPDGSRVVTYNYTRNSYALTWSTDGDALTGDYTGKSGNVKYEAPITAPNTPTKTGYTFSAWSPTPSATMPAEATTYTATWTCKVPNITKDPVSAVYALNDEATPLSVTVEDAGTWCGYQWQSSSDSENWSDIAEGDGGKAATYTPSTASAGTTTYYRVIVRNITDDCSTSRTSGAASVEVSSLPVCATPTFTPSASVAYNSNQTITISSETTGATIYYTMGTTPADPTTGSTQYDPTNKPVISSSATIKAIAVLDGYSNSAVASASYELQCLAPTFSPVAGNVIPGQEITLSCATADAAIYYSTDGNNPTIDNEHLYDPENKPVVSSATTIKAVAVKSGWSNSTVASAAYAMIYTVTLNAGTGSVSAEGWTESAGVWTKTQASAGSSIPLPDAALSSSLTTAGWSFAGWKTTSAETTQTETKPDFVNKTYTPTSDITLYAVYQKTTGAANYELVEEDLDDAWAGDYLIAYSSSIFADGRKGGKDASSGQIGTQSNLLNPSTNLSGKVVLANWGDLYYVTLEEISENSNTYVLKTQDNKYNYQSSNANGLAVTDNKATAANYPITVTFTSSSDIKLCLGGNATGAVFRFNNATVGSGGQVFRFYKDGGQQPIYLYKKGEGAKSYYSNPSDQVTLTYDANGATAGEAPTVSGTITIGTNVTVVAKPNDLVKTGYDFGGWNTKDDGTGTNYENGTDHQSFTINENTTLYAKWTKHNYTVKVTDPGNGNAITAPENNASVEYDAKVTLTSNAAEHWSFTSWTVTKDGDAGTTVDLTDEGEGVYSFNMPDYDVAISATFTEDDKVKVIWHVNYGTSETPNIYVNTPFSQLIAPAVADNAVSTCANKFMGWATAPISIDNETSSNVSWADATNVSSSNKDFYAVWATETESENATTYTRITDAADFVAGQKIVIVTNANPHMLGNDFTGGDEPTETSNDITVTDSKYVWTIGDLDNGWFQLTSGNVTLSAAGGVTSSNKYQYVANNTSDDYSWWTIDDQLTTSNCFGLFNESEDTDDDGYTDWISYLEWFNNQSKWETYYVNNFNTETYFALRFYKQKYPPTYSNYITNCCLPVENALTITNANQVATGNTLTLSSTGGNGGTVVWSVVNGAEGTATISEGVLTGGNLGTVTLKAHQDEYNNYCAQDAEDMTVTIVAATVPVTSVSLNHTTAALLPGETIQLNATLTPGNATDQTIGWVSGTPAKATVSNAGLVTAVAKGTSTVTATANGGDNVSAECAVTVHGLTILKQDETGTTISAEGVTASATGKSLSASAGETQYVFKGWKYAENGDGGLNAIANASNASITLTGTPTDDVTIIAEFYKPVTITWLVDGEDAAAGSQTLSVARGTLWSALTPAAEPEGNALGSCATAFVGWSNSMNDELRGNGNPAPAVLFRNAQISSYDTEITDPITFRAVFATSASGATFDGTAGGQFYIYANVGGTYHYAKAAVTSNKLESTTSVAEAALFTFTKHETEADQFTIKIEDNYYAPGGDNTNLKTQEEAYWWTISETTHNHGSWHIASSNTRGLLYQDYRTQSTTKIYTRFFGNYNSSNVNGNDYFDVEIAGATSYSNYVTVCCTPHTITVNGNDESENKTVSADVEETCDGMTVNLSRNTSCTHYTFNEWVIKYTDGEGEHTIHVAEDENHSGSFTMPAAAVTVEGDWSPVNYKVTIASAANGSATVKEGYATDENGKWIVPYGSTVTLQATPNDAEAYYFAGWTLSPDMDVQKSQAELPITMTGSFTATPSFAPVVYSALTLGSAEGVYSLSATLANGDEIPDPMQIKSGTALKVTYALSGQNEYVGWTFSVNSVEKTAEGTTVTFNMPEEDLNVSLNTRPYYLLNLSAEHGSITGVSIAGEAQDLAAQYIVHEGEVVALTAAPADDTYKFKEWTGATVSYGQFTVGTSDLDVAAVFELKDTYTLTLMALGSEQEKIEGILEGESIWEQIDDKEAPEITGQLFLGWSLMEDDKDMIISEGEDIEIGEGYTTLYAVYQAMTPCYVKVTSTSDIKNGKYLIVYETGGLAFDGGLETLDAASNTIGVEINTVGDYKTIEISNATTAAEFTIASLDGGGYSITSASGMYIGRTSDSNGMNANANTQYTNTMNINNDGNFVCVGSGGAYMRYNSNSGQERFRYFKYDTYTSQKAIQLYKRAGIPNDAGETASIPTVTITTPVNADEIYPDGKAGNIVIEDGGSININTEVEMKDLTVNDGGSVEVNAPLQADGIHLGVNNTMTVNSTVNVPSFSISVKLGSTGEATNVTVSGSGNIAAPEGYVDMELSNDANPDQWHAFTVPFEVDALNGIYDAETGAPLQNEVNYAIMDYHGDIRAQGKYGWKKYRGTLKPGVFYLITVDGASKVLRFMKKAGSSYVAPNSMAMKYYGDNDPENTNNGWCGVGNQNMFGGYVPFRAQILNSTGTGYVSYVANETKFSACIPFFIQIESDDNLAVSATLPSSVAARRVAAKGINDIKVTFGNENYSDKLYISANEDAKNAYEVGKDLVKMTMTNTPSVPQIFGNAYGNKLCMVYAPMSNDQAVYDLSLYAPANGEYTIAAPEVENADLYLTKDGAIIWNLTMSEYPINLSKGTTEGYGLLLKAKAPQTPTGVEQSEVNHQPSDIQKIIINDNVFILRGGQMYDVTGKAVK